MVRAVLAIALFATTHLPAADFSGRWAGTMETDGSRIAVYLNLTQYDGKIGGSVATGTSTKPAGIENAELRDGQLTFQVNDNANRPMRFRLTLSGGVLGGEATVGAQLSKVAVVPIGGGSGDRAVSGTGIGLGSGAVGPAGPGGGVFRIAGGVSAPVLIRKVDPEYTEEARAAKYQGTVLLYAEIAPDGTATNIKVSRGLGLGLDEKAIQAVRQWKFKPGEKDGKPVTVAATIEVNFRL
jgi:TonB family protein